MSASPGCGCTQCPRPLRGVLCWLSVDLHLGGIALEASLVNVSQILGSQRTSHLLVKFPDINTVREGKAVPSAFRLMEVGAPHAFLGHLCSCTAAILNHILIFK